MIGILGKKLGMTQLFEADGTCVPVTVVQAGPCAVLQVKVKDVAELAEDRRVARDTRGKRRGPRNRTRRPDGYYAVQLGFEDKPDKSSRKPEKGHAARVGASPKRFVREIRLDSLPTCKEGDRITVEDVEEGLRVDVTGTTKGRGFAGTIKRWNFQRQAMSHGNSKHHRKPGGIGRWGSISKGVHKGKKMCGHYGVEKVTVQNLKVVKVDKERNLLFLEGAVPGHRSGYVVVRPSVKKRG